MENIDINAYQENLAKKSAKKVSNAAASDSLGKNKEFETYLDALRDHYAELFKKPQEENDPPKAFIITNIGSESEEKNQYILKISPEKLELTTGNNESKKHIEYSFQTKSLIFNNQKKPLHFMENFVKKLTTIGNESASGKAEIFQEE